MLKSIFKTGMCCLLLAGLGACGGAPSKPLPAAQEQAMAADKAGHRALRDNDLVAARNWFTESKRLQQTQDNLSGIALATINLSTVYHRLGDDAQALTLLDGVLQDKDYAAELRAIAAFRQAVILLDGGKDAAAVLGQADGLCASRCAATAGIHNVRARVYLSKNDYAAAIEQAKQAQDAAGQDIDELANARRIQGAAQSALGQHQLALAHYQAALELDKQSGASARIAHDLRGMSDALKQLGRSDEAASYFRRAAAVLEATNKRQSQ